MPPYVTFNDILRTTNRLAYVQSEGDHLLTFLRKEQKNGLLVNFHEKMMENGKDSAKRLLTDGILIITCPEIAADVVFAKIDAGRGILGGQKARVANYLGNVEEDTFMVGASHRSLLLGLTGINNIYRDQGFLVGPAW